MARVTYVKKARKAQGSCYKCSTAIEVGDSYKWFANRIGRYSQRKNFCRSCSIKPSDMTTSPHLSALYASQEAAEEGINDAQTLMDMAEVLTTMAEEVREVGQGYEESADAIVDGFGHDTYQSDEIREKAESCESWASELEDAASEIENGEDWGLNDEELAAELGLEIVGEDHEDYDEEEQNDYETQMETARDERRDAATNQAEDAIGNCPL